MPDITIPVLNAIIHPPYENMARTLDAVLTGPLTGTPRSRPCALCPPPFTNTNAVGYTIDIFTLPAGWGRTPGDPITYENRLAQCAAVYTMNDGHQVVGETFEFFQEGILWLWRDAGPDHLLVTIPAGVALTCNWVISTLP